MLHLCWVVRIFTPPGFVHIYKIGAGKLVGSRRLGNLEGHTMTWSGGDLSMGEESCQNCCTRPVLGGDGSLNEAGDKQKGEAEQLNSARDIAFLHLALWPFYGGFVWGAAKASMNNVTETNNSGWGFLWLAFSVRRKEAKALHKVVKFSSSVGKENEACIFFWCRKKRRQK